MQHGRWASPWCCAYKTGKPPASWARAVSGFCSWNKLFCLPPVKPPTWWRAPLRDRLPGGKHQFPLYYYHHHLPPFATIPELSAAGLGSGRWGRSGGYIRHCILFNTPPFPFSPFTQNKQTATQGTRMCRSRLLNAVKWWDVHTCPGVWFYITTTVRFRNVITVVKNVNYIKTRVTFKNHFSKLTLCFCVHTDVTLHISTQQFTAHIPRYCPTRD